MKEAPQPAEEPCRFCGYEFDQELLGIYGCPNCEGEGIEEGEEEE